MNKYILIVLGVILLLISGWVLFSKKATEPEEVAVEEEELIMTEKYNCADGVVLGTLYISEGESVEVSLPNGRNLLLNSVESDSGFQFESPNGDLILSVKGDGATVTMNGEILVDGCKAVLDEIEETDTELDNELLGTLWRWQEVDYSEGENITPNNPDAFVLTLRSDGSFGASTDCNSVGGSYDLDGDSISFKDTVVTEMFCEGSQETDFIKVLSLTKEFKLLEKELTLILEDDKGEAFFESTELVN